MTVFTPRTDCEVAVIGAGPFGLAVASALKGAGVDTLTLGGAMSFWRDHMPVSYTHLTLPTNREV